MSRADVVRIYLIVAGCVCFLASPSFAEKQVISDQELDRVGAAGACPAVSSTCDVSDNDSGAAQASAITQDKNRLQVTTTTNTSLTLNAAQQVARTLTLNNVVGTNQVATGVNVSSGGPR
jgi:hypothetical protein